MGLLQGNKRRASTESRREFPGRRLTVVHDGVLCGGVGECERAQGSLFVRGREPWCKPETDALGVDPAAATAELAQVLSRCPTGALSAQDNEGSALLEAPGPNQVTISNDGPLYLRGELAYPESQPAAPGLSRRAALCRCGHSKNKPFCDRAHRAAGFEDSGAVGSSGTGDGDPFSGPLEIKALENGPLILKGRFAIVAGTGRVAWSGQSTALCRCGQSQNKPFCDGSHAKAGFVCPAS